MSVRLMCMGDVMLGENLNHYNRSIRTKFHPDYKRLIPQEFYSYLNANSIDLIFYNLEYSLSPLPEFKGKSAKQNIYKGTPETLSLFEGHKIAVNIANNHFAEHGKQVCDYTKKTLREKEIAIIGETPEPVIFQIRDQQLLIFGVTLVKDKHGDSEYFKSDFSRLLETLKIPQKKEKNEFWIISIHWGDEYLNGPSIQQQELGKLLIDNGFDLIIGHHPHTIQPVEFYKDKLIIYSLGNFIFDQNFSRRTQTGLVLDVVMDTTVTLKNAFLSRQKKYVIRSLKTISLTKINRIPKPGLYTFKKKLFSQWYRLLMKLEVLLHLNELDKETIADFTGKFKGKIGLKKN